jgi:hypothetical protein
MSVLLVLREENFDMRNPHFHAVISSVCDKDDISRARKQSVQLFHQAPMLPNTQIECAGNYAIIYVQRSLPATTTMMLYTIDKYSPSFVLHCTLADPDVQKLWRTCSWPIITLTLNISHPTTRLALHTQSSL